MFRSLIIFSGGIFSAKYAFVDFLQNFTYTVASGQYEKYIYQL